MIESESAARGRGGLLAAHCFKHPPKTYLSDLSNCKLAKLTSDNHPLPVPHCFQPHQSEVIWRHIYSNLALSWHVVPTMVSIAHNCSFIALKWKSCKRILEDFCWSRHHVVEVRDFLHHHEWRKGRVLGNTLASSDRVSKRRMLVFVGETKFDSHVALTSFDEYFLTCQELLQNSNIKTFFYLLRSQA